MVHCLTPKKFWSENMKTIALFFLLTLLVCAGCANHYDITLSNGTVITAKGKPRLDEKRHIFFFTDANGKTNVIPEFRVTQIAPQSMAGDDSKKFDPVVKK